MQLTNKLPHINFYKFIYYNVVYFNLNCNIENKLRGFCIATSQMLLRALVANQIRTQHTLSSLQINLIYI